MKIKMYNTEIIHYQADEYISLRTGGWHTPTTFQRIKDHTGVWLHSTAGVKYVTDSEVRVSTGESREGKANGWLRQSIPFIEGLRYHESDCEIHPDDLAKIPTEHRRTHWKPTKETDAAFKKLFAKISKRVRFSLNLGAWADRVIEYDKDTATYVAFGSYTLNESEMHVLLMDLLNDDYEVTDDRLYDIYVSSLAAKRVYSKNTEDVNVELKRGFATFRKKMKDVFVDKFGATEKCGGEVLGNGYWVNEKER